MSVTEAPADLPRSDRPLPEGERDRFVFARWLNFGLMAKLDSLL
jgi:hypothetical protein